MATWYTILSILWHRVLDAVDWDSLFFNWDDPLITWDEIGRKQLGPMDHPGFQTSNKSSWNTKNSTPWEVES